MPDTSQVPRRRLGKTGVEVSALGVGGYHLGFPSLSDDDAIRLVRSAVDAGVTFMDNNWGYNEGRSEERMGKALREGYRDRAFLMTKVESRDRDGALRELDESLRRLQTDHVDLWQIHEISYDTDPVRLRLPGGVLEALDVAKQAGKTRFVGFTGHKDPDLHLRTLEVYDFDTVQMPLNVMDAHFRSFEKRVLPELLKRDIGVIAMKSLGAGLILKSGAVSPAGAIRYTLSLPVSTIVVGMESQRDLEANLEITRGFTGLAPGERESILAKTAPLEVSGDGRFELYKVSMQFDADPGRKVHHFPSLAEMSG